jgi:hypothetical protein
MNREIQKDAPKKEKFGVEAIAGALERLSRSNDQHQDHTQGNYGAWDNSK